MKGFVFVEFNKNYCASRGAPIMGVKGDVKELRMNEALKDLIDSEVVSVVKKLKADTRKKAAGKKGAETS